MLKAIFSVKCSLAYRRETGNRTTSSMYKTHCIHPTKPNTKITLNSVSEKRNLTRNDVNLNVLDRFVEKLIFRRNSPKQGPEPTQQTQPQNEIEEPMFVKYEDEEEMEEHNQKIDEDKKEFDFSLLE